MRKRLTIAGLLLAAGVGLAGCNGGYGYSDVQLGYGTGYYDGYPGYYGWYGDYYYPGAGYYVYDRYRRPFIWSGDQRRYWEARRAPYRGRYDGRPDWNGFGRVPGGQPRFRRPPGFRDGDGRGPGYRDGGPGWNRPRFGDGGPRPPRPEQGVRGGTWRDRGGPVREP